MNFSGAGQTAVHDHRGGSLAMIDCPGSEWVLKIGPIERQNSSGSREQSEAGAKQMVLDAANAMLKTVLPLGPELLKGMVCDGHGTVELAQEDPDVQLASYQLPAGNWFTLGVSNVFGLKVVGKKG